MVDALLSGLFAKLASTALFSAARRARKALFEESETRQVITRAINATAESFPQIEGLQSNLRTWCESETFASMLDKLSAGHTDITDESIVSSFVQKGQFYLADETTTVAEQIVRELAQNLHRELLSSGKGLVIHALQQEMRHQETIAEIQRLPEELISALKDLVPQIGDTLVGSRDTREEVFHAKVDEARALMQQGKYVTALARLRVLRNEVSAGASSSELQFRIATNIGCCCLQLADQETAETEFEIALTLQPQNPKALANASVCALFSGKNDKALELARRGREVTSKDPDVVSLYILVMGQLGREAEIEQLRAEQLWINKDPACLLQLGQIEHRSGKLEQAESLYRASIVADSNNPHAQLLLAQIIVESIQDAYRDDLPMRWRLPADASARLNEAEETTTIAVEMLTYYENRSELHSALTARAGVRGMLARFAEALRDCERVLTEDESHLGALWNKGLLLIQTDKYQDAIECLEGVEELGERLEVTVPLAEAYCESGRPDKAIELLTDRWRPDVKDRQQLMLAELLLKSHTRRRDPASIAGVVHRIEATWGDNAEALLVIARQRAREGNPAEAAQLLDRALSVAKGNQVDWINLERADLYFYQKDFAKAADKYAPLVDKRSNNPPLQRYLLSLFYSGLYRTALSLAREVRGSGPPLAVLGEVESLVLEYIRDYEGARRVRLELAEVFPKSGINKVEIALLDLRRGNRDEARKELDRITFDDIKDDARALMSAAVGRSVLGMPEALRLAYEARQIAFGDPDIHLAYVALFLNRDNDDPAVLPVTEIQVGCAVHLEHEGQTRTFTILEGESHSLKAGEISSTDPIALKLSGLRKGQRVELRKHALEEVSYLIKDIQNKYVFAFQETLSNFSTWFPDNKALFRITVKDDDFSKIFWQLDERHRLVSQAMTIYRNNKLPLGTISRAMGNSRIEVWAGMVSQADGRVMAATGTPEEQLLDLQTASQATKVCLDTISLLSFGYLDLLDRLPKMFDTVLVPQSVLDEFSLELANIYSKESMATWKEGDKYFYQDRTSEAVAQWRGFLEKVRGFIESSAEVVATSKALDFERDEFERLKDLMGEAALASQLVAQDTGAVLCSDDLGLRVLSKNEWKITSTWSLPILHCMKERGLLTFEEYEDAVVKLALGGYHFVSIRSDTLKRVLMRNEFRPTEEVRTLFSLLSGPDVRQESAVKVVAEVIKMIRLERLLPHQQLWMLEIALESLVTGRSGRYAIAALRRALESEFQLISWALPEVLQSIAAWARQKVL